MLGHHPAGVSLAWAASSTAVQVQALARGSEGRPCTWRVAACTSRSELMEETSQELLEDTRARMT